MYRLTRESKNFGKVWWSGGVEPVDFGGPRQLVPEISFVDEDYAHLPRKEAEHWRDDFNANLGPNSPHWQIEQVEA